MGHLTNTWWSEIYKIQGSYISGYTNPSYNVLAIDINDKDLDENLGEDIIVALVKETREEEDKSAVMAVEMYQDL